MERKGGASILDLDFYVLNKIFGHLYEHQKFNLAKAHPYLSEALVFHYPKKYIDVNFSLNKNDIFIVKCFGPNIKSLRDDSYGWYGVDTTNQMLKLAAEFCPNLEVIEFLATSANENAVEQYLGKLRKLKFIQLDCKPPELNTEMLVSILKDFPNLSTMSVYNWKYESLIPLEQIERLDHLAMSDLVENKIPILKGLWKKLNILRTEADLSSLTVLSKYCVNLEFLKVRLSCYDEGAFAHFPKLKRLKIFSAYDDNDCTYLKTLHGKYNNQLEILELPRTEISTAKTAKRLTRLKSLKEFYCKSITIRAIRYFTRLPLEKLTATELEKDCLVILLSGCKSLKFLHMDYCDADGEFLNIILDILKSNGFSVDQPFTMCLYNTKLVITELNLCANKNMLKIIKSERMLDGRYMHMRA